MKQPFRWPTGIDGWAWPGAVAAALAFGLQAIARFTLPGREAYLASFDDDFFYYLKVGQEIATHGRPTFNGIIDTNGFHPLWQGIVALFVSIGAGPFATMVLVMVTLIVSVFFTFLFSARLAFLYSACTWLAFCVGLITTFFFYRLATGGMESIVAVPLFLAFACHVATGIDLTNRMTAWGAGLFMAVVALARLDAALFFLVFWPSLFVWAPQSGARSAQSILLIALGAAPLWLYFLLNRLAFGIWLPVSGLAKQLKPFASPVILARFNHPFSIDGLFVVAESVLGLVALVLLFWTSLRTIAPTRRAIAVATLAFPLLFYSAQCLASDWPLWGWYRYPWIVAFPVAAGVLFGGLAQRLDLRVPAQGVVAGLGAVFLAAIAVRALRPPNADRPAPSTFIYLFAKDLRDFAAVHPGRYAMGDRAGLVGYLLPDPVLQLEGLVGDRAFVRRIAARRNLLDILADYRIDYYVARDAVRDKGCYDISEPFQAGPYSPHVAATICREPVLVFSNPKEPEHLVQSVFDLRGLPKPATS
jgi:hypothetical protein